MGYFVPFLGSGSEFYLVVELGKRLVVEIPFPVGVRVAGKLSGFASFSLFVRSLHDNVDGMFVDFLCVCFFFFFFFAPYIHSVSEGFLDLFDYLCCDLISYLSDPFPTPPVFFTSLLSCHPLLFSDIHRKCSCPPRENALNSNLSYHGSTTSRHFMFLHSTWAE